MALIWTFNRLQLQGELQSKKEAPRMYRGVLHGVGVIAKNEGFQGLFRGIGAAVFQLMPALAIEKAKFLCSMCIR